jgi:zinc and cadmium transporter
MHTNDFNFSLVFLFGAILLSGLSFFLFKSINRRYLKLTLSFTGAFLFSICVMEMIPSVYANNGASIGLFILVGFFSQIIIEFFSEGIEHGHIHVHHKHEHAFPLTMMIGLCIHSFLEAMPLPRFNNSDHSHHSLLYAIILHHIPIAFSLLSMLKASGTKPRTAVICLIVFAAMPPLGAISSTLIDLSSVTNAALYYDRILAVVIGIFLHVSTTILFETGHDHRFNITKLIVIILGASLAFV